MYKVHDLALPLLNEFKQKADSGITTRTITTGDDMAFSDLTTDYKKSRKPINSIWVQY